MQSIIIFSTSQDLLNHHQLFPRTAIYLFLKLNLCNCFGTFLHEAVDANEDVLTIVRFACV